MKQPESSVGDWTALSERVKTRPPLGKHFVSYWDCQKREECREAVFPSGNTLPKNCSDECFVPEDEDDI